MDIVITDHAYDRMKERLGWNKKAGARMAQKAYTDGTTHGETRGSLLRRDAGGARRDQSGPQHHGMPTSLPWVSFTGIG